MGGISSMALAGCVLVTATTPSCGTGAEAPELVPGYERLTVAFIPNAGQTDPSVNFQARALGGMAFFTQGGLMLTLPRSPSSEGVAEVSGWSDPLDDAEHRGGRLSSRQTAAVRLRYEGTSGDGFVSEGTRLPGVANFLIGNDPSRWKTDLPTYAGIAYEKMYPNIRIRYEGADGNLKSTIEVEPGGDPSRIRWTYDGVEDIILNHETGDLAVIVGSAERDGELGEDVLVEHAPIAWQVRDQQEIPVPVEFELDESGIIQFKLGAYDSTRPLIIDPTITYSTFVGSQTNSIGRSIDKDAAGNVYVAGETDAVRFPTTAGVKDTTANGGLDVFVTKLNSIGTGISYSTFLGGNQDDVAHAIAVDAATGEVWLVGSTRSTSPAGWPTKSPAQGLRSGVVEGFVAKLNAAGSDFVFSSYHGGNGDDYVYGVAVDGSGNGYTTGSTTSTNLTTVGGAHDSSPNGGTDAFFTKWSSIGARQYNTYLGGTGNDTGYDVAVAGNVAYVVGETASSNFQPVTAAPGWDASHNGGTDAFLVKFSVSGASPVLEKATYLGHTQTDIARGVAVNTSGEAYVVGETTSSSFPATITFGSSLGGKDAFVMRFSPSMTSYYYSARLAGLQDEVARAVAVDASDNPIVTGSTTSPVFADGTWSYASTGRGAADVFVTKLVYGAGVTINALIGGSGADEGYDVAVDSGGIYVAGSTKSLNYPMVGGVDLGFGGGTDSLVTKLNTSLSGLTFSTYLGGSASEAGNAIAAVGNSVFVAGYTSSSGFPTSATGADKTYGDGAHDAFVLKLDSLTNVMQYSTFIGGNGSDQALGLAVDASGNAYVAGSTTSVDLPVVGAPASVGAMGGTDAFLAKVNSAGNSLLMSFRLGGASVDVANDVAVDASGSLYVVGQTFSNPFLTVSPLQGGTQGHYDAFVSKLDTAVSPPTWVYSTHLGGSGADFANGVATDGFGNAFVVGHTTSSNFPIAGGPLQTTLGGGTDAFVTKLDSAGSALLYSTYFGGTWTDIGRDIAVNAGGEAYIVGESNSVGLFDVWGNCFNCLSAGGFDGFIAKFDAGATSLWYGTYLGGSWNDYIYGIHVDPASGTSTFVGQSNSSNHPVLNPLPGGNAISSSGINDVIVGQIVEDGSGMFSGFTFISYVGGAGIDQGRGVAVSNGDAFITGSTLSSDFDTTASAYDSSFNGDGDVFVTRIDL